jgi:hypothetical protein
MLDVYGSFWKATTAIAVAEVAAEQPMPAAEHAVAAVWEAAVAVMASLCNPLRAAFDHAGPGTSTS